MNRSVAYLATVLVLAGAPSMAHAWSVETSPSGADFTRNNSSNNQLTIYDGEVDGHDVAGEYVPLGAKDGNVSVNVNDRGAYNSIKPGVAVKQHRVVELVPNRNDDYGPWKYPR